MAPCYKEDALVEHLNNIFVDDNRNVTIANIRSPTKEFASEMILACLTESGFKMGNNCNLPYEMDPVMRSGIDLGEYVTPLQLMVSARKFFRDLTQAAGEKITDENTFGFNDLAKPESKRLKIFLSHFINYWLLCNSHFTRFSQVAEQVDRKASEKIEFEEQIENFKAKNIQLRKNKASSAMKAEKLRTKLDHDKDKLAKLTQDCQALQEDIERVKGRLSSAKEDECQYHTEMKTLEKNEFRLKTIAKADETKQDLEKQLEDLKIEEEAKLYQIKEYQDKGEKMDEEECLMKEAFDNLQVKQMKI